MNEEISSCLLIGVGGSGASTVSSVETKALEKGITTAISSICIDTDHNDLLRVRNSTKISLTRSESIIKIIERAPADSEARIAFEKLFEDMGLSKKFLQGSLMEGAGQLYELAWLAFEAGGQEDIIEGFRRHFASAATKPKKIIIAGSLSGPTGAALFPRVYGCIEKAVGDSFGAHSTVGVALSSECFGYAGVIPSSQFKSIERNQIMSLRDLATASSKFERVHMINPNKEEERSLKGCFDLAADVILAELEGRVAAQDQSERVSLVISDGKVLVDIPEMPVLFGTKDKEINSGSIKVNSTVGQDQDSDFPTTPSAIRPRSRSLNSILSKGPEKFALHTKHTIKMLQSAIEEQVSRKPNEPDELAKWEVLLNTLEISRDTLSVLYDHILEVKKDEPHAQKVDKLARAFEAAAEKLKAGCAYLDRETQDDGHYAKLHKVGVCVALGGVLSVASGASVVAAAAGVGAMFYGKDFAKSAFNMFSGEESK